MKIIVTGCRGQLGTEIINQLREGRSEIGPLPEKLLNATVIAGGLVDELDISNYKMVDEFIRRNQPGCRHQLRRLHQCGRLRGEPRRRLQGKRPRPAQSGTGRRKDRCPPGARLHRLCVLRPCENGGVAQDEATIPGPISAYGSTKLMGEKYVEQFCHRHFIVRTAWLYSYYGKNFVKTIVNAGKKFGKLEVVNDQCGNPTNAVDLAHEILQLCVTHEYGLYHCTGEGICCWYDFASEIIRLSGVDATVAPVHQRGVQGKTRTAPTAPSGAHWKTGCCAAPSATTCATGRRPQGLFCKLEWRLKRGN